MNKSLEEIWRKIKDNVYYIKNEYVVISGDGIRYLDNDLIKFAKQNR